MAKLLEIHHFEEAKKVLTTESTENSQRMSRYNDLLF